MQLHGSCTRGLKSKGRHKGQSDEISAVILTGFMLPVKPSGHFGNHFYGHAYCRGSVVSAVRHRLVDEVKKHMPALPLREKLEVRFMLI